MGTIVLIVLILIILGGLGYGGGFYGGTGNRYWGPTANPGYTIGGVIGLIIIVVLILMLLGAIGSHPVVTAPSGSPR